MLRSLLTIGGLLAVSLLSGPVPAVGAGGQVALPLDHRLSGILVDLYRPKLFFGHEKVSRGFVASRDGLVLAPVGGLEEFDFGQEVRLEWMDKRTAEGWIVWKDEEVGYLIIRVLDPMPLFPAVGWRWDDGPRPGEVLFAPGPLSGGQPTLSKAVVAGRWDMSLPSGRFLRKALLLTPSLGSGPLSGPLLDEAGYLVGMVSSLAPPPGFEPQTVVAAPAGALQPDLRAARSMRPPRRYTRPPPVARPSYRIGISIGSGGIRPRIGVGLGGVGGMGTLGTPGTRRDLWDRSYDPWLRREQEATDRAKTQALERALEQQGGVEPSKTAPLLTNSEPLPPEEPASGGPDSLKAGASTVASATGSGEVKEVSPEAFRRQAPTIGSTWNPAGPPITPSPAQPPARTWPVVIEPKVPESIKTEQHQTDRAKTEELERELARLGAEGSPAGVPGGEIAVLAAPPAQSRQPSSEVQESDLAALRARNRALEKELEMLRQSISGRR